MNASQMLATYDRVLNTRQLADSTRDQYMGWARRYVDFARTMRTATVEDAIVPAIIQFRKQA